MLKIKYNYGNNIKNIAQSILNDMTFNNSDEKNDIDTKSTTDSDINTTESDINSTTDSDINSTTDTTTDTSTDEPTNIVEQLDSELKNTEIDTEDADSEVIPHDDFIKIMKINYSYPEQNDPHFQQKMYKKREFYYHKIPSRPALTDYQDIKKFRDMACGGNFRLRSQQSLLSNFSGSA